jgi:hypothetical protein
MGILSEKSLGSRHHEILPARPLSSAIGARRCTITMTQGNPEALERRKLMYIVASDLSEESRYVVEWGIGTVTVIRDSDNL